MQKEFSFHACLGPETSQADVMALCGIQQLLDAALAGYHVTIFAYGQTGEQSAQAVFIKSEFTVSSGMPHQPMHGRNNAVVLCVVESLVLNC
jgi:hypothetical protein